MTDAELTALAAKAHGDAPAGFSPLTDDGDALRLAVKLEMSLDLRHSSNEVSVFGARERIDEGASKDPYAATRRAIVRAAASSAPDA